MKFLSLFFVVSLAFPCFSNDAKQGETFFKDKKYGEAAESFLQAEIDDPDELKHSYNRGVSSLLGKNFEEAIEAFEKSAQSENKALKKEALFNLGHAYYGKGDLEAALKAFDDYLKMEPESQEAKENKAWVEKRIEEKKQQQQENQDNSDENKDKDKDQEKQDQDSQDQNKKDQEKQEQDQSEQDQKDQEKQEQDQSEQDQKDQEQQEQDQSKQDESSQKQDQESSSEEEQEKESDQSQEEEQDSEEQKDQSEKEEEQESGKENSSSSSEMKEATQKEISKEELDRLLRSLENIEKVYGVPPKVPRNMKKPKKDW